MHTRLRLSAPVLALLLFAAACDSPTDPINISMQSVTLEAVGDSKQLEATVTGSDRLPEWESLNPEIVTVTRAGMVTAVAPGTAKVRATIGLQSAEGTVTVLPPVEVQLTSLSVTTEPSGQPRVQMQLRNTGGRGFYKIEFWQMRETPGGEHRRVLSQMNDSEAPVGMDISSAIIGFVRPDWVIVYSRAPNSTEYRMTGCRRVDGGTPCPMP